MPSSHDSPGPDPLDPRSFHILVALAGAPGHGYAIRKEVEERTGGRVRLWPATLYGLLSDLTQQGLLESAEGPGGPDDDPRRRYYTPTPQGRQALAREASRLEGLARLAREHLAIGDSSP